MKTYKVQIDDYGTKEWYLDGKLHREDGPAVEYADGDKKWYLNGKLHREDGPAVECANGDKFWCINNKQHREDGPAVEYADGEKRWFLNGEQLTQHQFNARTQKKSCEGKIIEVDGIKYKLTKA